MNNNYSDKLTLVLKKAHPRLAATYKLEYKIVFGAASGYINGKIFISYGKFGVALKLPRDILNKLFKEKGVKRLKYFPKGHIKKEYAVLPQRIIGDNVQFKKLLDKSVQHVLVH